MFEFIWEAIVTTIVWAFVVGVAITLFLIFAVPWIWHVVKPWLHAVTG